MARSWQILVFAGLLGGFFLLRQTFLNEKSMENPNPDEAAYFSQLRPVERELEDVRQHLREISRTRKTSETTAKIVADAEHESQNLREIRPVPVRLDGTHRDLITWSDMLRKGAVVANGPLDHTSVGEVENLVRQADALYGEIERRSAAVER